MLKSCQETEGIKTGSNANDEKLSRKRENCDSFGCKRGKAVMKPKELRQVWMQMMKNCQENERIVTALDANEEKLS